MTDASSKEYLEPYRQAVRKHGASFEATLWGSRAAQERRFDVMIDMVGFDGTSVLDVGCGKGDFAARLLERDVSFDRFVGYDAMEEMANAATERRLDRSTFAAKDVLADATAFTDAAADYACFSGTLNTMDESTARSLVKAAYDAAHQGVVFNFLSDRPDPKWLEKDLWPARRYDTVAWVKWALSVTPRVAFAQDYLDGHDATILMRH